MEDKKSWDEICQMAKTMLQNGHSQQEIHSALMSEGIDQRTAAELIASLIPEPLEVKKKAAKQEMWIGASVLIAGLVLTCLMFTDPKAPAKVFWVLIVLGGYLFIKGFTNYNAADEKEENHTEE